MPIAAMPCQLHIPDLSPGSVAVRRSASCDSLLAGLLLCSLLRAGQALAGDAATVNYCTDSEFKDSRAAAALSGMPPVPAPFLPQQSTDVPGVSTHDFRPLARMPTAPHAEESPTGSSMVSDTPVWRRLAEYRIRDQFRLVTLWETGGNSVSLQAGRRGDPTLQWTSRLSGHGAGSRGLLDELFSTSVGGVVGRGLRWSPRNSGPEAPGKPQKALEASPSISTPATSH